MHFRNYVVEKFNAYYHASGETHLAMLKNAPIKLFRILFSGEKNVNLRLKVSAWEKVGQSQS